MRALPALPAARPVRRACAPRRAARQAGFTMIEVLVALAIVAIALAACVRAVGSLAANERALHERLLAGWSADNVLGQLRLAKTWPPLGERSFDCSQGNIELLCVEQISDTPNPLFRRVMVSVRVPGHRGELAQLVTVVANETNRSL